MNNQQHPSALKGLVTRGPPAWSSGRSIWVCPINPMKSTNRVIWMFGFRPQERA